MASVLKYWKESASLIIASRRLEKQQPKSQGMIQKLFGKKESTSTEMEEDNEELLRFLMMKRSSGSSFMPNAYVFPGGKLDESDFSKKWLHFFRFNTGEEMLALLTHGKPGPPIYSRQRELQFSSVPAEIALRVAAIRETFEESGILLARSKEDLDSKTISLSDHPLQGCVADVDLHDKRMKEWRKIISSDSSQFLNFCQEIEVVPDIWSLYEWSNWLTPTFRSQRFDTAFFMTCIDEAPRVIEDQTEMVHGLWTSPSHMLNGYSHNMVNLGPPQLYELSRLIRFGSVDDLLALAYKRSSHRSQRWMAVLIACQDGLAFILPGDELYPESPDLSGLETDKIERPETFAELAKYYPRHHRSFLSHKCKQFTLHCNLDYIDGHILPVPHQQR